MVHIVRPCSYLRFIPFVIIACFAYSPTATADTPVTCDSLTATLSSDKNFYILTAVTSGITDDITSYTFNFGDHQSYTVALKTSTPDHHTASVTHTYQTAGVYSPSVTVAVRVNKQTTTVTSANCQTSVAIGSASSTLPNTGAGNAVRLFALASVAGTILYETFIWQSTHSRKSTRTP